jgi:hypothetical protein
MIHILNIPYRKKKLNQKQRKERKLFLTNKNSTT